MEVNLNEESLVKKTFAVAFLFTIYASYYDFVMAKYPATNFNITIKIIFTILPISIVCFVKSICLYWRMFIGLIIYVIYSSYYTYFLSLAYLSTGIQISFVFTILLIFELREFLILSILNFAATLLAGIYSPNIYSLSHFGDVRRGEDIENFISLYLMTMLAYGLVTYPRLKKLKEEYKFSKLGKATSFILHEISKPILNLEVENESDKLKIEDLKHKLEIARQLQDGMISNSFDSVNINKLINELLEENKKFIDYYSLKPSYSSEDTVWKGDSKLIKTILSNLIRNSIEAVILVKEHPRLNINLKDNCLKITNNFHSTLSENELFQPMKSTKVGNMGMGLYISKSLADSQKLDLKIKIDGNNFIAELSPL